MARQRRVMRLAPQWYHSLCWGQKSPWLSEAELWRSVWHRSSKSMRFYVAGVIWYCQSLLMLTSSDSCGYA